MLSTIIETWVIHHYLTLPRQGVVADCQLLAMYTDLIHNIKVSVPVTHTE